MDFDYLKGIGGGAAAGLFGDMFGNDKNPADAAMGYYNKIPGMERENYNPYIQRGNSAYDRFNPIYNSMSSDPAGFLEQIMAKYAPSKSFQLKRDEMNRAAGNSAAAGGMRGSMDDISNEAHISDSLMGDDMQQWLKNVLGIEDTGLQGEQHLYDTGYDATKNLTSDLSNVYGTQGSLAFQGQANQNKSRSDMLSALMKMGAGAGGFYFGGPAGAAAASSFF